LSNNVNIFIIQLSGLGFSSEMRRTQVWFDGFVVLANNNGLF